MTKPQPSDKCILCGQQPRFIGIFTPVASLGIGRAIPYAICDQHGKPGSQKLMQAVEDEIIAIHSQHVRN